MKLRLLFGSAASFLALAACSGAESSDLFAPPDSSQLGTDPSGSNGDSSGDPPAPSSSGGGDTGSSGSSGTSGSSGSSGTSSGGSSSGGTKDAGLDAPPPPPSGKVYCGITTPGTSCQAGTEVCCGSWSGGKLSFACEATGLLSCVGGRSIECDDQTDCPAGQICCGSLSNNSGYTSVTCRSSCNDMPGFRAVRFCDPKAAVDECAASGRTCGASQSLPGYSVCRD
ncbi:MAG: hypothetical protein KF850_36960 [Labilithrix sp.]|nr:hypothetical protein [Labilithrix sp.]